MTVNRKALVMGAVAGLVAAFLVVLFFAFLVAMAEAMLKESSQAPNAEAIKENVTLVIALASNKIMLSIVALMGFTGFGMRGYYREIEKQSVRKKAVLQVQGFLEDMEQERK